jgi:hypothetical protein
VVAFGVVLAVLAGGCSDDDPGGVAADSTTSTEAGTTTTVAAGTLDRYADYASVNYDDPAHWLCRPGADDVCAGNLDSTVVEADGTMTPEPFVPADDPAIDCFYVYPTISRDAGEYSDWDAADDEEGYAAYNQAARLRAQCRVFAPVYRQRTLTGLAGAIAGKPAAADQPGDPFADVLDAWRTYMAEDNDGRGVVLIGHSQGASMLSRLVQEEISPNEDVRDLTVSAFLAGSAVPADASVDNGWLPLCETPDSTGCIVTWASFRSTAPPPANSFFGAVRGATPSVAACTNPASLGGGSADLHNYFPSNPNASILASLGSSAEGTSGWLGDTPIPTPFVSLPGLVSGECVDDGSHAVLSVTVHPDPGPRADDIGGDLTPEWGLHLVDVNLVMGDVVDLVGTQSEAWAAAR